MLQVANTRTQLSPRATECACADAAPAGDDPCECVELGYCTAAADPHFNTFDGFNSPYQVSMFTANTAFRLVKTDTMEIQGLALGGRGWLSGFAVGGDFLKGHSLVMIMQGKLGMKVSHFDVLLDGKQILKEKGSQEHIPGVLDAQYRTGVSTDEIQEAVMKDLPEFQKSKDQGASYLRISGQLGINKDHFHFKLPEHVEIFADARYILIKMPKRPNMKGWCGNFNGEPEDDFKSKQGSKKVWKAEDGVNAADGLDFFDAKGSSSGFKDAMDLLSLAAAGDGEDSTGSAAEEEEADEDTERTDGVEAGRSSERLPGSCRSSAKKRAEAEKVCGVVSQPDKSGGCFLFLFVIWDTDVWKVYL